MESGRGGALISSSLGVLSLEVGSGGVPSRRPNSARARAGPGKSAVVLLGLLGSALCVCEQSAVDLQNPLVEIGVLGAHLRVVHGL